MLSIDALVVKNPTSPGKLGVNDRRIGLITYSQQQQQLEQEYVRVYEV